MAVLYIYALPNYQTLSWAPVPVSREQKTMRIMCGPYSTEIRSGYTPHEVKQQWGSHWGIPPTAQAYVSGSNWGKQTLWPEDDPLPAHVFVEFIRVP